MYKENKLLTQYASALIPTIIFVFISISVVLTDRDVSLYGHIVGKLTEPSLIEIGILQLGTLLSVGFALSILYSALITNPTSNTESMYRLILASCFLIFWVTQKVTAGISFNNEFVYQSTYTLIIILGVILFKTDEQEGQFRLLKSSLLVINVVALLFLLWSPQIVRQEDYYNALYLDYRYWGLASHANNLGPQLVLLGLLISFFPYENRRLQLAAYAVVFIALALSQSKTAIISCAIAFVLFRYVFSRCASRRHQKMKFTFLLAFIVMANAILIAFSEEIAADQSLTGRGQIWAISMLQVQSSPWFGGGASVWSDDFAEVFGYLGIASNAHNQIVDVLSSAGIVGLLALSTFLIILVYGVNLQTKYGKAFAFLLFFLMLRGFSEVPFKLGVVMSNDFALLITLVMFAVGSRADLISRLKRKNTVISIGKP